MEKYHNPPEVSIEDLNQQHEIGAYGIQFLKKAISPSGESIEWRFFHSIGGVFVANSCQKPPGRFPG